MESAIIELGQNSEVSITNGVSANTFKPDGSTKHQSEVDNLEGVNADQPEVKLISLDKANDLEEKERSKVLWIPLNPSENIEDYQTLFEPQGEIEEDKQEDFLRASEIPEAPMLKQEKMSRSRVSQSHISITSQHSSSSKLSLQTGAVFVGLFMSRLLA